MLAPVLKEIDQTTDPAIERLRQYLTIPSISGSPAHVAEVARAAHFTADALKACGLTARVEKTSGHPLVVAQTTPDIVANPGAPRVLFYGHYDVQPPEPLELWASPPFVPTLRDGAIYARGASDDKGQVHAFLEAVGAWMKVHGKLPGPLTILIEGEEEVGSAGLTGYLKAHAKELAADIVLISDTHLWAPGIPAIIYGLRGLVYFDVQLYHAQSDTHSGMYGGSYANPLTLLTQVLGQLFDEEHHITIPGFYEDVAELSGQELARWQELGFDEDAFLAQIGVHEPFGENGFDTLSRRWARPAGDLNGIWGGYQGPGSKTIIPTMAGAKVSFRIAPNQKAQRIARQFEHWLKSFDVHGCAWKVTSYTACDPVLLPVDSPWIAKAAVAIEHTCGRKPVLSRDGATIPVVSSFKSLLGLDSLLVGFGLSDDNLHAPNEKFGLSNYTLARRTQAALLQELAR